MKLRIKRILKYLIPIPLVIFVICAGYLVKPLITQQKTQDEEKTDIPVMNSTAAVDPELELQEMTEIPATQEEQVGQEADQENLAEQEIEIAEENLVMLSSDPIALCDLYAERGATAVFQCFYEGAETYHWEYYDMEIRDWTEMEDVRSGYDDLGRMVSYISIKASNENDGMMLRCRITFSDGEEMDETACLYVLDKKVMNVSVEDLSVDAGSYAYIHVIPVNVEYEDGTTEEIIGLSGLHFLETEVKSVEESVSPVGNQIETVTTVVTEVDYWHSDDYDYGEKEVALRYHPVGLSEPKKIDVIATFNQIDQNPPVISQVDLSSYKISSGADMVEVMVTISAEDDITPYPLLQYAILPKGQELTDVDWRNRNCFKKEFDQNGIWVIYCRDQYGNIGMHEKNIIVVDHDAPEIASVMLEKEGWQPSNTICVAASDVLSMTYSYSCAETGEDSGFISKNEYEITNNGTWTIRVMDAAGNTSTEQIYVSGIDKQGPVINSITTQKEEQ